MYPYSRRAVLAGAAVGWLADVGAATSQDAGEVIATATFRSRDDLWQINLTSKHAASFSAQLNRIPAGTIRGEFRFYDTEVADKGQLQRFLQLPNAIRSSAPSIHPWGYEIALRLR
jgi:hypothetical protein